MSSVAIITARGGSKRIPKKNIRDFCGKPIISYSIEAAINSELFDEIMVSTDSDEIAEIARNCGASIPFFRSSLTSGDYADTSDVLKEVLEEYSKQGRCFSSFCCIYPTAPFITPQKLNESFKMLQDPEIYNVVSMVPFSFPPQRGVVLKNNRLEPLDPRCIEMRSQDLDTVFHDCGQFYWCRTEEFFKNSNILYNHTVPYVVSEMEAQDIDNQTDWEMAEIKYRYMRGWN